MFIRLITKERLYNHPEFKLVDKEHERYRYVYKNEEWNCSIYEIEYSHLNYYIVNDYPRDLFTRTFPYECDEYSTNLDDLVVEEYYEG